MVVFVFYAKGLATVGKHATMTQHPPAHHPLDACYYSVVHEPQVSEYLVSF
jgi:hypothetical protein